MKCCESDLLAIYEYWLRYRCYERLWTGIIILCQWMISYEMSVNMLAASYSCDSVLFDNVGDWELWQLFATQWICLRLHVQWGYNLQGYSPCVLCLYEKKNVYQLGLCTCCNLCLITVVAFSLLYIHQHYVQGRLNSASSVKFNTCGHIWDWGDVSV